MEVKNFVFLRIIIFEIDFKLFVSISAHDQKANNKSIANPQYQPWYACDMTSCPSNGSGRNPVTAFCERNADGVGA